MEQSKYGMISQTRSESEMSGVTSRSGRQHLSPTSQFSAQQSIRSPSVASNGNLKSPRNAEEVDLHDLAKGWKAAIARTEDPSTRHEAWVKNDRGNLPLHSAASFRAPKEVTEALLKVYPEAASLTNNYGNLALHFTAWKKGPLDVEKLLLEIFPEGMCISRIDTSTFRTYRFLKTKLCLPFIHMFMLTQERHRKTTMEIYLFIMQHITMLHWKL